MVENTYKVPQKQWRKWNAEQRALFNSLYSEIDRIGPDLFLHPVTVQRKISAEEMRTICWNAAWLAADVLKNDFVDEIRTIHKGKVISIDRLRKRAA